MTDTSPAPGDGSLDEPLTEALNPAEALALAERQQRAVGLSFVKPVAVLYLVWGVAWLVGFLLLWLGWSVDWMPLWVAGTSFAVLILAAIVTSAIVGSRIGRGVQGASATQGIIYGLAWPITGTAFAAVGMGLISQGMSTELASLYFPSAYALMVGIMYILGGALWNARSQFVLGVILMAIGSAAPFVGAPNNNLLMAVGGVAFLVGAAHFMVVLRKLR